MNGRDLPAAPAEGPVDLAVSHPAAAAAVIAAAAVEAAVVDLRNFTYQTGFSGMGVIPHLKHP